MASSSSQPNVILILTDDQGFGDLSVHGNDVVETPNIAALAADGIRLDNFFATPLCAPTRAGLLTGRYHPRTGVTTVTACYDVLDPAEKTLGDLFRAGGWHTGIFGKWHSGWCWPSVPGAMGFDEFVGFRGGHFYDYFDPRLDTDHGPIETKGFITDILTDHALDFITRHRDEPFFCYLPYNAIHTPIQCPDDLFDKYMKKTGNPAVAGLYAMSENVDQNVGRLTDALKTYGLWDNTIVIYMTDNGPAFVGGPRYNAGMRGSKGCVLEGGVRVPCFIRWPRRIPAGSVSQELCAYIDLFPTLRTLCGIDYQPPLPLDGLDVSDVLTGDGRVPKDRAIYLHTMFVEHVDPTTHEQVINEYPGGIRTATWKYLHERTGEVGLYDLSHTHVEDVNQIDERPELAASMKAKYDAWLKEVSDHGIIHRTALNCGYPEAPFTEIPAQYAMYFGSLHFCGKGFEYDYLLGFDGPDAYMEYEICFQRNGRYTFAVLYNHPDGGDLTLTLDGAAVTETLSPFVGKPRDLSTYRIPKPDEEPDYKEWATGTVGTLTVSAGVHRIRLFTPDRSSLQIERLLITFEG